MTTDWLKQISHAARTNQKLFLDLVSDRSSVWSFYSRRHFAGYQDTSGSSAKCLLFSQASFGRLCKLFTFLKNLLTTWPRWTPGAHTDRNIFPRKSVQTHPLTTWCGNSSHLHLNKGHSIVVESTYTQLSEALPLFIWQEFKRIAVQLLVIQFKTYRNFIVWFVNRYIY